MKEKNDNFKTSFHKGDIWTKLSLILFGSGYIARGQYIKGFLLEIIQVLFFLFTFGFSMEYILKLGTLGTVQREEVFDPLTLTKTVNDYDNSRNHWYSFYIAVCAAEHQ